MYYVHLFFQDMEDDVNGIVDFMEDDFNRIVDIKNSTYQVNMHNIPANCMRLMVKVV